MAAFFSHRRYAEHIEIGKSPATPCQRQNPENDLPTEISHDIISGRLLFHFLFVRTIFSLPSENLALFLTS